MKRVNQVANITESYLKKYVLVSNIIYKRNQYVDLQHAIRIQGFRGQLVQGLRVGREQAPVECTRARKGQAQLVQCNVSTPHGGPCF